MSDIGVGVSISLISPDDFLIVKESLTRMGIASNKEKKLFQTCHILHKRGFYYLLHFKELFKLDGKPASITVEDLQRRNLIIKLLSDWELVTIDESLGEIAPMNSIKIISHKEKDQWQMVQKYTIGTKKNYY